MSCGNKASKAGLRLLPPVLLLVVIALFSVIAAIAAATTGPTQQDIPQDKTIAINGAYGNTPGFDDDNNGVAGKDSAIDFTATNTSFSWQVDEENLCTLWRTLPLQLDEATLVCYGAAHCCSFADLTPQSADWKEAFYLISGLYNVTDSAIVSAKVVYADYLLSSSNPHSDIVYSDWGTLTALFTPATSTATAAAATASAAAVTEGTIITVNSPSNISPLARGEDLALAVTANSSDSVLYSLDGSANTTMAGNTSASQSNYTATLQGTLPGGVMSNGLHAIVLYSFANIAANTTARLEHPFSVSDTSPPQILLSPDINGTNVSSSLQSYNINITSGEYANISYALNSGTSTAAAGGANVTHSVNTSLIPSSGSNNITITATDMHGNFKQYAYGFNFSYTGSGACTDAVQNYHDGSNETGTDCGGPCAQCVTFSVATDKETYAAGELVYISVTARADARHNIAITGPSYQTSFAYNGSTYYIISPANPGPYKINVSLAYRNLSPEYAAKNFAINSSGALSVAILANATTIDQNEAIGFRAQVTGNTSTVSYKWDLNGDGTTDSTSATVNYTYNSPGSYTASLNASDGAYANRATEAVTVRQLYNITINVTGASGEAISLATVTIKGLTKTASPTAQYALSARSHTAHINASGYKEREESITVGGNDTFGFVLRRYDSNAPVITLLEPADNATVSAQNITVKFTVQDETASTCAAYLNRENTGWLAKSATAVKSPSAQQEQRLNLSGVENGTYQWRIECADEEKHTNSSEARTFTAKLQPPEPASTINTSIDEERITIWAEDLSDAISKLSSYGKLEQEAAETLGLRSSLEKAQTELQRILRDIRNVRWRRFNSTEEEAFLKAKINDAEIIIGNATTGVVVIKSAKFVTYHGERSVREAAGSYLSSLGKNPSKREMDGYVKENIAFQQDAITTTGYKIVEMKRRSGEAMLATLVEKTIDSKGDVPGLVLLETIPKEMANSTTEVKFLFEYDIVKEDPVVRVKLPDGKKYAYYIEKELTQQQVQKSSAVFLKEESKTPGKVGGAGTGITGFAIFSGNSPLGKPGPRLMAEIIIVLLLGAVYLAYGRGMLRRESKQLRHINELAQQIRAVLQQNSYEKSKQLYAQAGEAFKQLKPAERRAVYSMISELRYEVDAQYVKVLISEATALLAQRRQDHAQKAYDKLSSVYRSLPPSYRKTVYDQCSQLYKKIAEKR